MPQVNKLEDGKWELSYNGNSIFKGTEMELLNFAKDIFAGLYNAQVDKPKVWFEAEHYGLTIWEYKTGGGWVSCEVDLEGNMEAEHMLYFAEKEEDSRWEGKGKNIKKRDGVIEGEETYKASVSWPSKEND